MTRPNSWRKPLGVPAAEEGLERHFRLLVLLHRLLHAVDDPLGLAQHRGAVHGTGDAMKHAAVGRAEVGRDIAALLLAVHDLERRHLLEGRDEVLVDEGTDFGFAKAFTRSACALFQVNFGSSKWPETWRTKTSFSSFFALAAASEGEPDHSIDVP
jgi:hypothetical protein